MSLNTDMSIFLQTSSILSASFEHFLLRSHSGQPYVTSHPNKILLDLKQD